MSATITRPYVATYAPLTTDVRFEGYYFTGTEIATRSCPNSRDSFKIDGTYAFCCASGVPCRSATTCSGSTRIDINGDKYPCEATQRCRPLEFYESYPLSTDGWSATAWWCLDDPEPSTVYQNMQIPLITTITTDVASSTVVSQVTPGGDHTPHSGSTGDSGPGSGSGLTTGAIAGVVVGAVVGAALIIGLAWYLVRESKPETPEIGDPVRE